MRPEITSSPPPPFGSLTYLPLYYTSFPFSLSSPSSLLFSPLLSFPSPSLPSFPSPSLPSFPSPSLLSFRSPFLPFSPSPLRCAARWVWAARLWPARLWPAHKWLSSWYGSNCLLLVCYSGHRSEWFHHIQGAAAGADQWELVTLQS